MKKHRKGCTFGWDGVCVIGCPWHEANRASRRLDTIREYDGVETPFMNKAKSRRWKALKFVSPGLRGVPDRIVLKGIGAAAMRVQLMTHCSTPEAEKIARLIVADVIEFVELKRPGKDATMQQLERHGELKKLGFKTEVIDTPAGVEKWYADRS